MGYYSLGAARNLDPHITKIIGSYLRQRNDTNTGMYMKRYIRSLANLIKQHRAVRTPIAEDYLQHIFESLVSALSDCYFGLADSDGKLNTVLHRDIKLGNIFLTDKTTKGVPQPSTTK
jgi:serine/threonine protein kinase